MTMTLLRGLLAQRRLMPRPARHNGDALVSGIHLNWSNLLGPRTPKALRAPSPPGGPQTRSGWRGCSAARLASLRLSQAVNCSQVGTRSPRVWGCFLPHSAVLTTCLLEKRQVLLVTRQVYRAHGGASRKHGQSISSSPSLNLMPRKLQSCVLH